MGNRTIFNDYYGVSPKKMRGGLGMAIVQDAYDLTDDILMKILTGEYRRIGSVIRYATGPNKGQIVKHLKPVRMEAYDSF